MMIPCSTILLKDSAYLAHKDFFTWETAHCHISLLDECTIDQRQPKTNVLCIMIDISYWSTPSNFKPI